MFKRVTTLFVLGALAAIFVLSVTSSPINASQSLEMPSVAIDPCDVDFNGNGVVDVGDIMEVANCWRSTYPVCNPYNLDGDDDIDIVDIMLVAAHWGEACSTSMPTTVYGVALGEGNADRETKAKQAGAEWYRIIVNWSQIEPNQPVEGVHTYDWTSFDNRVGGLRQRGLHPLVELRGTPDWALAAGQPPCGLMNSAGLEAYSEFLAAIVERSDGDGLDDMEGSHIVRYWEIGNEVDKKASEGLSHYGLCYGENPDEYAQLLARSWDAAHGADPGAKVVFGGMAYENCCGFNSDPLDQVSGPDFFDNVLNYIKSNPRSGGKKYFDVMNIHAYGWFVSHYYNPPEVRTKYQIVRNKLANCACGLEDVPLMNTEGGRQSNETIVWGYLGTPERQARYVPVLFVRSLAADLKAVFWYAMMDYGGHGYGLLTASNEPKPSYWAYKTLTDELNGYTYDAAQTGGVSWPSPVEGHIFTDGADGEKWAVFIPPQYEGKEQETQSMSFPFSKIKVVDYDKFNSTYPDGGGDPSKTRILCGTGSVNVTITVNPIFVQPDPSEPCP